MDVIKKIREKAKEQVKTIVLPEGTEPRVIKAAAYLKSHNLVKPVLLGDLLQIKKTASVEGVDLSGIEIIDPAQSPHLMEYANTYFELRKHKGMTQELALQTAANVLFYGALMIKHGAASGAVAGSVNTTGDVLRAGIQVVGLAEGISVVSSAFIMAFPDGKELAFGDCAVIPSPDSAQLASIAVSSADTFKRLTGQEPKIAMLSFSTKGSAKHEDADKVIESVSKIKTLRPDLLVDGELQFDAALIPAIAEKKAPGSPVAGKANVFIFPDLDAGNIGYKIAQRLGGAEAIGPVIQGLAKPYNDLSRGCSVDDIINVACICSLIS